MSQARRNGNSGPSGKSGDFDTTFGDGGHADIDLLIPNAALLPDQRIIAVGVFNDSVGLKVYRLLTDGRPDPAFGEAGVDVRFPSLSGERFVSVDIVLQSDTKMVVACAMRIGPVHNLVVIARLNIDGSLDKTFGNAGVTVADLPEGTNDTAASALLLPNDKVFVVARTVDSLGRRVCVPVCLERDGTFDPSFGEGGFVRVLPSDSSMQYASLQRDGKIVMAGLGPYPAPVTMQPLVCRLHPDGHLDETFGAGGLRYLEFPDMHPGFSFWECTRAIAQSDGKIVLMGHANNANDQLTWFSRLLPNGDVDLSFSEGRPLWSHAEGVVWSGFDMLVQPDDKFVVTGPTSGRSEAVFERCEPDGAADPTFGDEGIVIAGVPGVTWMPTKLLAQADGKLLIVSRMYGAPMAARLSRMML